MQHYWKAEPMLAKGCPPRLLLLANLHCGRESEWSRGEFDKRRDADGGAGVFREPVAQPANHPQAGTRGGGGEDVLESCFGETDIAGVAQISDAQPLADGGLNAGARIAACLELLGLLVVPRQLQRQVLRLGADSELARCRGRTLRPGGARAAGGGREADIDDGLGVAIVGLRPFGAGRPGDSTHSVGTRCSCSQSKVKQATSKPSPARACQRVSCGAGPITSTWCSVWLVTSISAST